MIAPEETTGTEAKGNSPLTFNFPSSANSMASDPSCLAGVASTSEAENKNPNMHASITEKEKAAVDQPTGLAQRQMRRFAKSADKRQSVHMLGSIEHLQHHFLKFGLAAKEPPNVRGATQPALGHALRSTGSFSTTPSTTPPLPPSPLLPPTVARPPYPIVENVKIDLEKLRADALESICSVEKIWSLETPEDLGNSEPKNSAAPSPVNVLDLLKASVDAIRSVRAYSMAIPSSMLPCTSSSTHPTLRVPSGLGRARQSLSTPSRPAPRSVSSTGSVGSNHGASTPIPEEDPLAEVRKAALEVLTGLRALEERSRIEGSNTTLSRQEGDDALVKQSDTARELHDGAQRPQITVQLEESEEEEDLSFFFPTESEDQTGNPKDSWYDRLNAADREGWLYRTDMTVDPDLLEEGQLIKAWLQAVDRKIFGQGAGSRGSNANSRRNSFTSEQELPFVNPSESQDLAWLDPAVHVDPLERTRRFLGHYLPLDVLSRIPSRNDDNSRAALLDRLSDGYLCIIALNAFLQRSSSPWGFVPMDEVYDTLGLGATMSETTVASNSKRDWTFRRAENIRCFGAALKQRYGVPLNFPYRAIPMKPAGIPLAPGQLPTSSQKKAQVTPQDGRKSPADGIVYDPLALARRDPGWETTFERVLDSWLRKVHKESLAEKMGGTVQHRP